MGRSSRSWRVASWLAAGLGAAAGIYFARVAAAWFRYSLVPAPDDDERDVLLDTLMPEYEIVERHSIHVAAPAEITLQAAKEQDLLRSPIVRGIFKTRELVFGATPDSRAQPAGLVAQMMGIGWAVLADAPGREIVLGAVTQPWVANVVFRPLPADEFRSFEVPGFVKIAWTLRADPIGPGASIFRTETRAVATDADARRRFRRYWAFVSPGVSLIRSLLLRPLKRDAERRTNRRTAVSP